MIEHKFINLELLTTCLYHGRRLGGEFGGREKIFADQIFK